MPDFVTVIWSTLFSAGAVAAGMKWLVDKAIGHKLNIELAKRQQTLDAQLEAFKARLEQEANETQARLVSTLRRTDEIFLGEDAAERAYRFEARKRLYTAVGPLRFQLLNACSQYLSRLESIGKYKYDTDIGSYFGRSLLYRLGRLLCLTELIERQTAYADFSVDAGMIMLLRFRGELMRALSSGDVPLDHPGVDWDQQKEHLFRDTLSVMAVSMIQSPEERVIRFDEFDHILGDGSGPYLDPLKRLIASFDPTRTPIFWLRLLAVGQACEGLAVNDPIAQALDSRGLQYRKLIALSDDAHIRNHAKQYHKMLAEFRTAILLPKVQSADHHR